MPVSSSAADDCFARARLTSERCLKVLFVVKSGVEDEPYRLSAERSFCQSAGRVGSSAE